ncbi:hypothetical protein P692DRAFT_20230770 [Suillus brevipes Sb2]|nr:hypothetical protein P692DRAFT_20230770 [Suillus brevipes Sb2]
MQLALQTTPSSSTQSAPDRVTTPIRIATSPMPARTRAPLNTEHVRLFAGSAFHDLMWAALSSYRSSTFPGRYIEVVTRFRNGFYATQRTVRLMFERPHPSLMYLGIYLPPLHAPLNNDSFGSPPPANDSGA